MAVTALKSIILLTGGAEAEALGQFLRKENPNLDIIAAPNRDRLDAACEHPQPGTRLISFCSPVIVPKPYLDAMECGSYNFHPGPPSYPGRYPSVFAIYEGAQNFGVTVHEMEARVDEGAIIAAEWFDVPEECDLETLDTLSFKALVSLFGRLAKPLATNSGRLIVKRLGWSGIKRSKADCDALCTITPSTPSDETALRVRACGPHLNRID